MSLGEDNQQNELFQAKLHQHNIYLDYERLLRKHPNLFPIKYFNNLIKKLQRLLKEYNEAACLIKSFLIF